MAYMGKETDDILDWFWVRGSWTCSVVDQSCTNFVLCKMRFPEVREHKRTNKHLPCSPISLMFESRRSRRLNGVTRSVLLDSVPCAAECPYGPTSYLSIRYFFGVLLMIGVRVCRGLLMHDHVILILLCVGKNPPVRCGVRVCHHRQGSG